MSVDLSVMGQTGLIKSRGILQEEPLKELKGNKWRKTLRQMIDNDPIIGAILYSIEMMSRQVEWVFEPIDESNEALQTKEFVETVFEDMSISWDELLPEILDFVPWGWSYFEILWKQRQGVSNDPTKDSKFTDGRIGIRRIEVRAQESLSKWGFDPFGEVTGMYQLTSNVLKETFIPIDKSLLFRSSMRKNSPEGKSVLRRAYTSWYYKTNIQRIEGIGIERDLAGMPVAKVPARILRSDASSAERALATTIQEIVTRIKRDELEGIVWPLDYDETGRELYTLELLSSSGSRQFDTDKVISRYDRQIAMLVLADFIFLGHEKVGSYALASSKTSLFSMALGAYLDVIATIINERLIPKVLTLNSMNLELRPSLVHGDVETQDLNELGTFIEKLSRSGMPLFPNNELERYLLRSASLPETLASEAQEEMEIPPEEEEEEEDDNATP